MITDENLPGDWVARSRTEEYDRMIDRELESVSFEREDDGAEVHINEVQEPKDFGGWGYQVVFDRQPNDGSTDEETFGIFGDLDEARQTAIDCMKEHR